ncbi:hypothetical protein [Robertmurraya kyonggiensis]|uniref:Uncharacterized protein n=1 Tax=Robertmurraya kyonggiensis TaxID=1037680 RepID=A0A4U1CXW4_9BACI|nr:hypothetical protein [Robertmurraya kyonggiensis]TKC14360.1 hypothetical protein FA727_21610 [Robertmurraya kyonggiensis]
MNRLFAFFLILLISIFSYYQFDGHIDGLKVYTEQEKVTFKFSSENNELPLDDSDKQTSYDTFSYVPFVASLVITIACLSYMFIVFLRCLALLTPVRFKSNYVDFPLLNN